MPLIIEGPDHVGKTTFAHKLVKQAVEQGIPAYYAHMSAPPKNWNFYSHYLKRMQPFAVQDRFHLGGLAYGQLGGKMPPYDSLQWEMLDAHITLKGGTTLVIYSGADGWLSDKLLEDPKEEMFSTQNILEVNSWYRDLAYHSRYLKWDVAKSGYPNEEFAALVIRDWAFRLRRAFELKEIDGIL